MCLFYSVCTYQRRIDRASSSSGTAPNVVTDKSFLGALQLPAAPYSASARSIKHSLHNFLCNKVTQCDMKESNRLTTIRNEKQDGRPNLIAVGLSYRLFYTLFTYCFCLILQTYMADVFYVQVIEF